LQEAENWEPETVALPEGHTADDGHAPCLPCWPIKEIKLQGKVDGFDTDDLIVFVQAPSQLR